MLDYCHAPTPYLIGVHSSLYQRLIEDVGHTMVEDGIAILDIDNQAFYSNDIQSDIGLPIINDLTFLNLLFVGLIPKRILKELEDSLKGWNTFSGGEMRNIFVTAQARLLANYRRFVT